MDWGYVVGLCLAGTGLLLLAGFWSTFSKRAVGEEEALSLAADHIRENNRLGMRSSDSDFARPGNKWNLLRDCAAFLAVFGGVFCLTVFVVHAAWSSARDLCVLESARLGVESRVEIFDGNPTCFLEIDGRFVRWSGVPLR